jgi:hypothetical protein
LGINVIHFKNDEVENDLDKILEKVKNCFTNNSSPAPSPRQAGEKGNKRG